MNLTRARSSLAVVVAGSVSVWAVGGCVTERHVLGDAPTDASRNTIDATANQVGGGGGGGGNGGSAGATASDASTGGMTVVSLGDTASSGWPVQIPAGEIANRLSQLLFRKPASAALTAAVVASAPRTNQAVGQLTEGLLLEEGSLVGRQAFYRWWLGLDLFATAEPDPALFPAFTPEIRQALIDGTLAFIEDVTWRPQGDLATLLTEPAAFVTQATAPWFPGVAAPTGPTATRVSLDPAQFAGIVTQPPVLTIYDYPYRADPTMRGLQVRRTYLCQDLPPVPPTERSGGLPPMGTSIRQWVEGFSVFPACASCHSLTNPVGFAFGHFDAVGAYHDTEGGLAVDTTGTLWTIGNQSPTGASAPSSLTFSGPADLAAILATSPDVRTCFAAKWLLFSKGQDPNAYNRWLSPSTQGPTFEADARYIVARATIGGLLNLRGTIRAVTETHTFLDPY